MPSDPMNQNEKVQILDPSPALKKKVGDGGINPAFIKRAEKRLDEAAGEFPMAVKPDIEAIATALKNVPEQAEHNILIEAINAAAFDLKGNGGTYGFPTFSRIADNLNQFTELIERLDRSAIIVVELHLDALKALCVTKKEVDFGQDKEELVEGLAKVVQKYLKDGTL